MVDETRRRFLSLTAKTAAAGATMAALPACMRRALEIPAAVRTGTIKDVKHVVILMQENRSFDHYFGTLRGVRGFGDRHPVPLASGKPVWWQSDGEREITPFHLDTKTTSAIRVSVTPHSYGDAQGAWNQGKFGFWPQYKKPISMGHYQRDDIPFQFALAEAFTICDAYHCSVTTGTDPNRIVFWSGSNFDPELCAAGENCTDADSEPNNLRCWVEGELPDPGYTYAGSAFTWPTIPDVLEREGISWRIYQNPNDNWTGAMHGGLAFASFRTAQPDSPLYRNGMSSWSLEQLAADVKNGTLPQVSWVLPPAVWSEHPVPSSPLQGAEFTSRVLDALTSNPEVWASTVLFLAFDENDGQFDHVPPPAPPSYNPDGTLAGKSTLDLKGVYFTDPERKHIDDRDTTSGTVRPWGLGPRVPMYVISPWSKGGWVNSQVFDHTSVGRFLEQRFGVHIPAISRWHRAVSGDLTSAFDFEHPERAAMPALPDASGSEARVTEHKKKPTAAPPAQAEKLFQEPGTRPSRALPYELSVSAQSGVDGALMLEFRNTGKVGAVFHVYDKLRLERIPRRYTVEAGKAISDSWSLVADGGSGGHTAGSEYDLWVSGPNGFLREFRGRLASAGAREGAEVEVRYDKAARSIRLIVSNLSRTSRDFTVHNSVYGSSEPWSFSVAPGKRFQRDWSLTDSRDWYDLTIASSTPTVFMRRLAGRLETGAHGVSDPAMVLREA
ncbi:MAG: phospholipase C, phosphocholine-specific [Gammaproteobacteria bacterium]